jgi:penicillin-binding protein-related factor A (putative recombinase)
MPKKEATFNWEIRTDLKDVYQKDIHVQLIYNQARSGKKPYDFYFNYKDHFTAVECKRVMGNSFNVNQMEAHQQSCLEDAISSGGSAFVLVWFFKHKTSFIFKPTFLNYIRNSGGLIKIDELRTPECKEVYEMTRIKDENLQRDNKTRWAVEEIIRASVQL